MEYDLKYIFLVYASSVARAKIYFNYRLISIRIVKKTVRQKLLKLGSLSALILF